MGKSQSCRHPQGYDECLQCGLSQKIRKESMKMINQMEQDKMKLNEVISEYKKILNNELYSILKKNQDNIVKNVMGVIKEINSINNAQYYSIKCLHDSLNNENKNNDINDDIKRESNDISNVNDTTTQSFSKMNLQSLCKTKFALNQIIKFNEQIGSTLINFNNDVEIKISSVLSEWKQWNYS